VASAVDPRRIGDALTLREAIGGRWSTHWMLWLAFFPGTTAVVLIRESTTVYPDWWWPLLSAAVQHLVAGVILVGGGRLARRRRPILSIRVVAAIWGLSCVVRAVIGGVVAEVVAGVPGDLLYRAVTWILMTAAWGPAIVYGIAQIGRRRALIGELEAAHRALEDAAARTAESGEAIRARLARTIRRSVAPVLDDLRDRLLTLRHDLDRAAYVEISRRLSSLHEETVDLIEAGHPGPRVADPPLPPRRASLHEAFDVHLDRPWLTSSIVSIQTLAVVLPDGARIFGGVAAVEVFVALVVGGIALGATLQACESWPLLRRARASSATLAAVGAAILAASWVMLHSGIDDITWHGATLLPVLSIGLVASCTTVTAALVVARANQVDQQQLDDMRAHVRRLEDEHEAALERERHRLSELMHGPVQGRIAACVMALTFLSAEDAAPGALASITEQVLGHLDAASRDLSSLAEGVPPNGGA